MADDDVIVSDEAKRRVDVARVRDVAFQIKKAIPDYNDDDAEALARVLLSAAQQGVKPNRAFGIALLLKDGLLRKDADRIVRALPE